MFSFEVHASSGSYTVREASTNDLRFNEASIILVDEALADSFQGDDRCIVIPADERHKSYEYCGEVLALMQAKGLRRNGTVAAIGGGVVQDVATFASSVYMRGVRWLYVPTTMNALADSCLGGKSSINLGPLKNIVGGFYPPNEVLISTKFIPTLSNRAKLAGLAEAVKITFARGQEAFARYLESPAARNPGDDASTSDLIRDVLTAKKWFIETDEFDQAERQLLNFGHSFGHALEAATSFRINHGLGVAIGMRAAMRHPLAARTPDTNRLDKYIEWILELSANELKSDLSEVDWGRFALALESDKKNSPQLLRLVLPIVDSPQPLAVVGIPFANGAIDEATTVIQNVVSEFVV